MRFIFNRLNKSVYQRHVSRTVFMVIDAMRTDFIQNQQKTSMKYLNKMISDGTACVMNLNVEVPTVTMPRIKVIFSEEHLRTRPAKIFCIFFFDNKRR